MTRSTLFTLLALTPAAIAHPPGVHDDPLVSLGHGAVLEPSKWSGTSLPTIAIGQGISPRSSGA